MEEYKPLNYRNFAEIAKLLGESPTEHLYESFLKNYPCPPERLREAEEAYGKDRKVLSAIIIAEIRKLKTEALASIADVIQSALSVGHFMGYCRAKGWFEETEGTQNISLRALLDAIDKEET